MFEVVDTIVLANASDPEHHSRQLLNPARVLHFCVGWVKERQRHGPTISNPYTITQQDNVQDEYVVGQRPSRSLTHPTKDCNNDRERTVAFRFAKEDSIECLVCYRKTKNPSPTCRARIAFLLTTND